MKIIKWLLRKSLKLYMGLQSITSPQLYNKQALSLDIEHDLKLLSNFSKKTCVPTDKLISISDAFKKVQRVVGWHTTIRLDLYTAIAHLSPWHTTNQSLFSSEIFMYSLSSSEKISVTQFHNNLLKITSMAKQIDSPSGAKNNELEQELINTVVKVLKQGHPL